MDSLVATAPPPVRSRADLYAPIVGDLEEVERILHSSLKSERAGVQQILEQLGQYEGKRLRPALVVADGPSLRRGHRRTSYARGRCRDDSHRDPGARRRTRRGVGPAARADGECCLGQPDERPIGRLPLHARISPHQYPWRSQGLPSYRRSDQPGMRGGDAANHGRGDLDLSESDYLDVIDGKTAELTACCCRLGALYSAAPRGSSIG